MAEDRPVYPGPQTSPPIEQTGDQRQPDRDDAPPWAEDLIAEIRGLREDLAALTATPETEEAPQQPSDAHTEPETRNLFRDGLPGRGLAEDTEHPPATPEPAHTDSEREFAPPPPEPMRAEPEREPDPAHPRRADDGDMGTDGGGDGLRGAIERLNDLPERIGEEVREGIESLLDR